jgi:hypothetical protein
MAVTVENASNTQHAPIKPPRQPPDALRIAPDASKHAFWIDPKAARVEENTMRFFNFLERD